MFEFGVVGGERVALWFERVGGADPGLRVLVPGPGGSVRERAVAAVFVPSVQQVMRRSRVGGGAGRRPRGRGPAPAGPVGGGSPVGRRRVVLPGDPTPAQQGWGVLCGNPGKLPVERARAERLGLVSREVSPVVQAVVELMAWRSRVAALPPGPELVAVLADRPDALAPAPVLRERRPGCGDGDGVVSGFADAVLDAVTARARVVSWLMAEQYTDLAVLSAQYPGLAEMLPTEVGFAVRTSDAVAGGMISTARALAVRLPGTLAALRAGVIDQDHAIGMVRATGSSSAEVAARVEADLLPLVTAPGSTITGEQLRRRAARRVIVHDPDGAADRHRTARKDRGMARWLLEDGMAALHITAAVEQIALVWEAISGLAGAAAGPGDTRSLGNRRVDALTDLCSSILTGHTWTTPPDATGTGAGGPGSTGTGAGGPGSTGTGAGGDAPPSGPGAPAAPTAPGSPGTDGCAGGCGPAGPARPVTLPTRHGHRPQIHVLVPYTVLLGGNDPCELAGHGPITADQARLITADGVLHRLLCDPVSGTVLDYGRTRYQPPASLTQFITARDGTCRAPGCDHPATSCQIDHITPYRPGHPTGGPTSDHNLGAVCTHHHRAKDGGGFTNTRDPDGTSHWTTPLGRHYHQPPHQTWHPDEHPTTTPTTPDWDDHYPTDLKTLLRHHGIPPLGGQPASGTDGQDCATGSSRRDRDQQGGDEHDNAEYHDNENDSDQRHRDMDEGADPPPF